MKDLIDTALWPEANEFKGCECLDAGWGDKDFYLTPGMDLRLGIKALFYSDSSALRIACINSPIEDYIKISDAALEIKMDSAGFENLLSYIHNTYKHNEKNKPELISERNNGMIKYYIANGNYSVFNTCNTWAAKGLNRSGLKIPTNIFLTQQLFKELEKYAKVLKSK